MIQAQSNNSQASEVSPQASEVMSGARAVSNVQQLPSETVLEVEQSLIEHTYQSSFRPPKLGKIEDDRSSWDQLLSMRAVASYSYNHC